LGIKPILLAKKENACKETEVEEKLEKVENTLGLVMQHAITLMYYIQQKMKSRKRGKQYKLS